MGRKEAWEKLQGCTSLVKLLPDVNSLKIRDWFEGWKGSLLETAKKTLEESIRSSSYITDTVMKRFVEGVLDKDGAYAEIVGVLEDEGAYLELSDFEGVRREIVMDALGSAKDKKRLEHE
jgi:hypothetical protein